MLAYSVLTEAQKKRFEKEDELDFSFGIQNLARFRGNVLQAARLRVGGVSGRSRSRSRPSTSSACRRSSAKLAEKPRGLVLVTGPTGSRQVDDAGRDDRQDQQRAARATSSRSRTRSSSSTSTRAASSTSARSAPTRRASPTRSSTRCARIPDVVLVGEMRDLETDRRRRCTIAETGHLAFATLHTNSARRGDQPHHRRLPGAPAVAGARAAGASCSRASSRQTLLPRRQRQGPRRWPPRSWCRRRPSGPDPRRQGPPDLLADAGGQEARHADA